MTEGSLRADAVLVARGLARSRGQARELILAGAVRLDGRAITRPATPVAATDELVVTQPDHYVSRAAHKLLGALDDSGTRVSGRVLDAGASTGGFTQVLLERGARQVYAVDVGHGQLAESLRLDPRVRVHEGVNLRDLALAHLDGRPVDLVVADVSFISLTLLLPGLLAVLDPDGAALLLVKPQFEAGRSALDSRGVVRDPRVRDRVVDDVAALADSLGWPVAWRGPSRLPGPQGNVEFFLRLARRTEPSAAPVRV